MLFDAKPSIFLAVFLNCLGNEEERVSCSVGALERIFVFCALCIIKAETVPCLPSQSSSDHFYL